MKTNDPEFQEIVGIIVAKVMAKNPKSRQSAGYIAMSVTVTEMLARDLHPDVGKRICGSVLQIIRPKFRRTNSAQIPMSM